MATIAAPEDLGLAEPVLGVNAAGVTDYETSQPFIDVFKMARPWGATINGEFGAMDFDALREGGYLDNNGWPISLPPGEDVRLVTLMQTDLPDNAPRAGRYEVSYEGTGEILVHGAASVVSEAPGRIVFDVAENLGEAAIMLEVLSTDPNATGDYLRNISVVREDLLPLHEAGAIFDPAYIAAVEDSRVIRFKDWQKIDETEAGDWEARARVDDAFWTTPEHGAPIEVMVSLANQVGADPWFNIPHRAEEGYDAQFAALVAESLDADRHVYIEFSNEVWNSIFPVHDYAREQAALAFADPDLGEESIPWAEWYGLQAADMAMAWEDAFAGRDTAEAVSVLAGFQAVPYFNERFTGVAWEQRGLPPLGEVFDEFSIGGYFGNEIGAENFRPLIDGWIGDADGSAGNPFPEEAFENALHFVENGTLPDGAATPDDGASSLQGFLDVLPEHVAFAQENGLGLNVYEGGQHIVDANFFSFGDPVYNEFFIQLADRPEIADLYHRLFEGWRDAGGGLFVHFQDVQAPGPFGNWGLYETLDPATRSVRGEAFDAFNQSQDTFWDWGESRGADSFLNGQLLQGTPQADTVAGTAQPDILIGNGGDDTLTPGLGDDSLHGGAGTDTLILSGTAADYGFTAAGTRIAVSGPEGDDLLFAVEQVQFDDTTPVSVDDLVGAPASDPQPDPEPAPELPSIAPPNIIFVLLPNSPDTIEITAGTRAALFGDTSDHAISIASGGAASGLDAGTDVEIAGNASDFTFVRNGTTLEVWGAADNRVAQLSASAVETGTIGFADGGGAVTVEGNRIVFGGEMFDDGEAAMGSDLSFDSGLAAQVLGIGTTSGLFDG